MTTILFLWFAGVVHVTHPCIITVWFQQREMTCTTSPEADEGITWYLPQPDR